MQAKPPSWRALYEECRNWGMGYKQQAEELEAENDRLREALTRAHQYIRSSPPRLVLAENVIESALEGHCNEY